MISRSVVSRYLRAGAGAFVILALGCLALPQAQIGLVSSAYAAELALSYEQISAIQGAVKTALANVNPSLTGAARDAAIKSALADVTVSMVKIYGSAALYYVAADAVTAGVPAPQVVAALLPAAVGRAGVDAAVAVKEITLGAISAGASPTQVAEAVISTGALAGLAPAAVGTGLGAAAAQLAKTDQIGADQIARVVSNEGTSDMRQAFYDSVIQNGGTQALAQAGTENPEATGETAGGGNGNTGNNGGQFGTGGSTLPTCTNPSCT